MDIQEALEVACEGRAILFTGAGFSIGAKNLNGDEFKNANKLKDMLNDELDEDFSDLSLMDVSDFYIEAFGEEKMIEVLRKEYKAREVCAHHLTMAEIPWRRVFTTNYDNIFELSCQKRGRICSSIILSDERKNHSKRTMQCIHINGFIERVGADALSNEFKLTEKSYYSETFRQSVWWNDFQVDTANAGAIFFVGYSLYDLDIARVLAATEKLRDKCFFVTYNPSTALKRKYKRFGQFYTEGVGVFGEIAKQKLESYTPIECEEVLLTNFEKYEPDLKAATEFSDNLVFDYFLYGKPDPYQILRCISNDNSNGISNYYLNRHQLTSIWDEIKSKSANRFLIHADLGNGKSALVDGLKILAVNHGFSVYEFRKSYDENTEEIEDMLKHNPSKRKMVVIDDVCFHIDLLREVSRFIDTEDVLLASSRTSIYELHEDVLHNILVDYKNYDVNLLDGASIKQLIEIFNENGFWGEHANSGIELKRRKLEVDCKRQFQAILMVIMDSPNIKRRFSKLLEEIESNKPISEVLILVFALECNSIPPSLDLIMQLLDTDIVNQRDFRRNTAITEIFNVGQGQIAMKSSVLSKYLLSCIENPSAIVKTLIKAIKSASKLAHRNNIFETVFKNFSLHRNIETILPKKNRRDSCISLFEGIKNIPRNKRNPYFWLQYAISRLAFDEFDKADKYFKSAYSYAKGMSNFDTYQIDNHYARFLIERSIKEVNQKTCMENFRKAHSILSDQATHDREKRYYPFKVARLYYDFYEVYFKRLGPADKERFIKNCKHIYMKFKQRKVTQSGLFHYNEFQRRFEKLFEFEGIELQN